MVLWMEMSFKASSSPIENRSSTWSCCRWSVQLLTMPFAGRLLDRTNPMRVRVWGAIMCRAAGCCCWWPRSPCRCRCWWSASFVQRDRRRAGRRRLASLGTCTSARKDLVQHYIGLHVSATGLRGMIAPFLAVLMMPGFAVAGRSVPDGALVFALAW